MSTAKFDTLQNAAGSKSVPVATVVDGSAKAWVNFNGTGTVAIRAAFNCTSITDTAAGVYTLNITIAFADTSVAVLCNASDPNARVAGGNATSTTAVYVNTKDNNGTNTDYANVFVAIFR